MTVQTWANIADNIMTTVLHIFQYYLLMFCKLRIPFRLLQIDILFFVCQYFWANKIYDTLELNLNYEEEKHVLPSIYIQERLLLLLVHMFMIPCLLPTWSNNTHTNLRELRQTPKFKRNREKMIFLGRLPFSSFFFF